MSETPLSEIETECVLELTVHDNAGNDYQVDSASIIGAERSDEELVVWVDSNME